MKNSVAYNLYIMEFLSLKYDFNNLRNVRFKGKFVAFAGDMALIYKQSPNLQCREI